MTNKKTSKKEPGEKNETGAAENVVPARVLTSVNEVAEELSMSVKTLRSYLRKYPFCDTGVSCKLNGRWHVPAEHVWRWYHYVKRQETRHPDARRMRPEEPPALREIKGR